MSISLAPYQRELSAARSDLEQALRNGTAQAVAIAIKRVTLSLMADDIENRPQTLAFFEHRKVGGLEGPQLWRVQCRNRAAAPFERRTVKPEEVRAKDAEYQAVVQQLRERWQTATHVLRDRDRHLAYLVQENEEVKRAVQDIVLALAAWVTEHNADEDFLTTPAYVGVHRMLSERQDLLVALRLAQRLPKDVEVSVIPPEQRPAVLEIVEAAVAMIPVVGTAVAVVEVTAGYDLFGYEIDEVDRCVIGASALLPFAGRFVKGGRALYTAARMERLYGPQAARYSLALAAGERVSAQPQVRTALKRAGQLARAGKKVETVVAQQLMGKLSQMSLKSGSPGIYISKYLSEALSKLIKSKSVLAELDELALLRVVQKGPNINLMKGQLLEEFLEARIARWLRDPAGAAALGLKVPPPQTLEFIPGHMIRDAAGRQLTDGIIGHREGGKFVIVAIFEAKAGKSAARELRLASESISSLSAADRAELRAYALDVARSRANQARLNGRPFPKTIDEIEESIRQVEREIALSEQGGQVRRDIERLAGGDGSTTAIWLGEDYMPVKISPKHTKVFGVLPTDVRVGNMESQLQGLGFNFEVLGMNVTEKELVDLSTNLTQTAQLTAPTNFGVPPVTELVPKIVVPTE